MSVPESMRLEVLHVQGRRIACPHCRKPFTFLAVGGFTATTTGLRPGITGERLRIIAAVTAKKNLQKLDRKERWGEGFCPHCRRFPPWMARKKRFRGALQGGAVGLIFGFFLAIGFVAPSDVYGWRAHLPLISFLAAIAGCFLVGWKRALPGGPVPGKDSPLSLTDEELATLFVHARESGEDPVAAWWATVNARPPEGIAFATMGFRDFASGGVLPPEWTSEAVLGRL